jgi:tRNA pseudouridine55 synthase
LDGVLIIDKPLGPTSFDVVQKVRKLTGTKKAGHTGTLDPMATGVLPICLNDATKIAGYILHADKTYETTLRLGVETDTQDAQGKIIRERPVPELTHARIEEVLKQFRGPLRQIPPMYSAIKVNGQRLYELAREGKEVEREARDVVVHSLELLQFEGTQLSLRVHCSKGFYVRVLGADIGEALGCGAHLTALRRIQSGPFQLQHAVTLEMLQVPENWQSKVVGMCAALSELPMLQVTEAEAKKVLHGGAVLRPGHPEVTVRVMDPGERMLAIASVEASDGKVRYLRVLGNGP